MPPSVVDPDSRRAPLPDRIPDNDTVSSAGPTLTCTEPIAVVDAAAAPVVGSVPVVADLICRVAAAAVGAAGAEANRAAARTSAAAAVPTSTAPSRRPVRARLAGQSTTASIGTR